MNGELSALLGKLPLIEPRRGGVDVTRARRSYLSALSSFASRMLILEATALLLWLAVLVAPWQAWRCRERLEPQAPSPVARDDFTVVIPARDEAQVIGETLRALSAAAPYAPVILVDDESSDGTAQLARDSELPRLSVVTGSPPPPGWAGKLWALTQGLERVHTSRVLLLDADIRVSLGMIEALCERADEGYAMVSALAEPRLDGPAARILLPAFVYFFKLVYPFALANRPGGPIAAAAGGVVLIERAALERVGGFAAWRDAIIDDCTLAAHVKQGGYRTYLGLTHGAASLRRQGFASIAAMVARSAYVQLRESPLLLLAVTALMLLAFWAPVAALAVPAPARWVGIAAWSALAISYLPTLRYYGANPLAAAALPLTATFFLAFTWYSALRARGGVRSTWKGRRYRRA